MVFKSEYLPGASPLDPLEMQGLIPEKVYSQHQLNMLEQYNILTAMRWLNHHTREILDENFARKLHLKMFGEVWNWAGSYRRTPRIGIVGASPEKIAENMHLLMADVRRWINNETYTWPQILALFHYNIVFIQPFPNGNGRFARTFTEALAKAHGQKIPTWGELKFNGVISDNSQVRTEYINALRRADDKKISSLVDFLYS